MIDLKQLTDDELWLLTCGMEHFHDSMRHNSDSYKGDIVDKAGDIRGELELECAARKLDHKRWEE